MNSQMNTSSATESNLVPTKKTRKTSSSSKSKINVTSSPAIEPVAIKQENLITSMENLETLQSPATLTDTEQTEPITGDDCVKKRGRKPNGGKIIKKQKQQEKNDDIRPNVILHLKCFVKDLEYNNLMNISNVEPYSNETITNTYKSVMEVDEIITPVKTITTKLKELEHNLHTNNVNDKKSSCFCCTYPFDNTPYYIPKCYVNNGYEVYGCFCMPECATYYLFNEKIDSTVKFERYAMLNHIYGKVNGYTKNIKPAPNPFYTLDKYYGNLTIQEYRSLSKQEKYFCIVDKPLTRVMPELYEENDTHIIHNKFISASAKLKAKQSKNSFLNEAFSVSN